MSTTVINLFFSVFYVDVCYLPFFNSTYGEISKAVLLELLGMFYLSDLLDFIKPFSSPVFSVFYFSFTKIIANANAATTEIKAIMAYLMSSFFFVIR